MAILSRKNTTPDVPTELADAYESAEPNPGPFMEQAASQLARELHRQTARGAVMIGPEDRRRIYSDHFPELTARAEHLSRLAAARWVVEGGARFAALDASKIQRDSCAICGEVNGYILAYMNPALTAGATLNGQPRMCTPCRYTADLLYAQATTSPARQAAVRAALGIPEPRK
jgi:hypothetical protein